MAYVPKFKHLFMMLFRVQDPRVAEGLFLEGTWHHDQGDDESARMAFSHARALDRHFGGAFYSYAALTEKKHGATRETLAAWRAYVAAAENDPRQARPIVDRVRGHVAELERQLGGKS